MSKIKLYETRDFSSNFDTTLNFLKQNYGEILKPVLIVIPLILIAIFFKPEKVDLDYSNLSAAYAGVFTFKALLSRFLYGVATFIVMIYTSCYMAEYVKSEDGKVNSSKVWSKVFGAILPVFAASLLYNILVIIGAILCIIPGIMVGIYLAFYMYVYVVEDRGVVESLQRSYELVKGNWWSTFGYFFVWGLISIIFCLVFMIPQLFVNLGESLQISFLTSGVFVYITDLIAGMGDILMAPIMYVAGGIMYFSYRNQLEGIDMESDIDKIGNTQF